MRRTVLAIIGPPFSGSTIIQYILNSNAKVYARGELYHTDESYYFTPGNVQVACSSCHPAPCPVFKGLPWKPEEVYDRCFSGVPDGGIIIDSSKSVEWYNKLYDAGVFDQFDMVFLWLIRDPWSWIKSYMREMNTDEVTSAIAFVGSIAATTHFIDKTNPDLITLDHSAITSFNKQNIFDDILKYCGINSTGSLDFDTYWNIPIHQVAGNTAAFYGKKPFEDRPKFTEHDYKMIPDDLKQRIVKEYETFFK